MSLEILVGWSIVVIFRFLGFYAGCVPQPAVTSSEFLNLSSMPSIIKPLEKGVRRDGRFLKKEKRKGDRIFFKAVLDQSKTKGKKAHTALVCLEFVVE